MEGETKEKEEFEKGQRLIRHGRLTLGFFPAVILASFEVGIGWQSRKKTE